MIHQENSTSSLISKDFVSVVDQWTVSAAISVLRERKEDFQEKFAYVYVTNAEGKLIGVLRIRDLLVADEARFIRELMKKPVVSVTENALFEEIIQLFRAYSFRALPVTDQAGHLIGAIPIEKLPKHLTPTPSFFRFPSFVYEEVEGKNVWEIVAKRLPWFLISVTSGLVCAYTLGLFVGSIESIIALILFVPIILGLAGSVGTQSAQVTLRGLMEGKLSLGKIGRILAKEILMSLMIGGIGLLLTTAIALLWKKFPVEGIALSLSIVATMTASGILGTILPVVFKTLRINSNFASGLFPLLMCDILALIVYFMISLSFISPTLELG
ncbi:MAG: magnesium transporter [Candidatus Omnitrophica bacterium]|nr:magnesium transporter [Candidatus Omnitrophota bacterium]